MQNLPKTSAITWQQQQSQEIIPQQAANLSGSQNTQADFVMQTPAATTVTRTNRDQINLQNQSHLTMTTISQPMPSQMLGDASLLPVGLMQQPASHRRSSGTMQEVSSLGGGLSPPVSEATPNTTRATQIEEKQLQQQQFLMSQQLPLYGSAVATTMLGNAGLRRPLNHHSSSSSSYDPNFLAPLHVMQSMLNPHANHINTTASTLLTEPQQLQTMIMNDVQLGTNQKKPIAKSTTTPVMNNTNTTLQYTCSVCNKEFGTKGSLKTHSRVHTGERPFVCPVAGCGRSFSQHPNCVRHIKLLHGGGGKNGKNGGNIMPIKTARKGSDDRESVKRKRKDDDSEGVESRIAPQPNNNYTGSPQQSYPDLHQNSYTGYPPLMIPANMLSHQQALVAPGQHLHQTSFGGMPFATSIPGPPFGLMGSNMKNVYGNQILFQNPPAPPPTNQAGIYQPPIGPIPPTMISARPAQFQFTNSISGFEQLPRVGGENHNSKSLGEFPHVV
jgi:hypothetical protein